MLVLLIPVFCILVGVIFGGVLGALGGGILGALIGGVLGTGIGAACDTGPDPAKSAPEEHNALGSEGPSQPAAGLTAFWIVSPSSPGLLGFGVTSRSQDDALRIICALGYGSHLPDDLNDLRVTEGVKVAELDQPHVVAKMGPIDVRGMWYPFVAVGVPEWVDA